MTHKTKLYSLVMIFSIILISMIFFVEMFFQSEVIGAAIKNERTGTYPGSDIGQGNNFNKILTHNGQNSPMKTTDMAQKTELESDNKMDFSDNPPMTANLGGGDDISTATVITALPFIDVGNTSSFADDYDEDCAGFNANSPDVVYSYTPTQKEHININLCNSDYMTNLWVYENDESTVIACNIFNSACSLPRSKINNIILQTGNTYYIVIDGENGDAGDYEIEVTRFTLNVEVDYMVASDHSHELLPEEVDAVVAMFACEGIILNIEVSDAIPHVDVLDAAGGSFFSNYDPETGFLGIKLIYYDHWEIPGWHYCLMIHQYDRGEGVTTSSGLGELPGDDFVVSLGAFFEQVGTPYDRAGTFAHEFGHNLNLTHAGDQSQSEVTQYKPNLVSIMGYRYQLGGVRQTMLCENLSAECIPFRNLDYSHGLLPALDETALDETVGMGYGPVDWNCNGVIDTEPVVYDLTGYPCTNFGSYQVITDYDEWSNIVDVTQNKNNNLLRNQEVVSCITKEEYDAFAEKSGLCVDPSLDPEPCVFPYVDSDGDGIGDDCDNCPSASINDLDGDNICDDVDNCLNLYNPDQADINSNGIGDICECSTPWRMHDGEESDNLGWRVDLAGDFNNDGYEDYIYGARRADINFVNDGQAYVRSGKNGELLLVINGEAEEDHFGVSVSGAGDLNGDGYDDVIVGAWLNDISAANSGRAYVFYGSSLVIPDTVSASDADMIFDGPSVVDAYFGWEVESIGDVDSELGPDILIGAQYAGYNGPGMAFVYSGQTGDEIYAYTGENYYDRFGYAIGNAGDFDNDGTRDFIIGARTYYDVTTEIATGKAYIYSGDDGQLLVTITGEGEGDNFGGEVSGAGDVNNDNFADVIIGAPFNSTDAVSGGRAYVFYGGLTSYPVDLSAGTDANMIFTGSDDYAFVGWSVSYSRDLDGDNVNDLVVAAPATPVGGNWRGVVYVYSGFTGDLIHVIPGATPFEWFGRSVVGSGNARAENTFDMIIGAFDNDAYAENAGRAYVYHLGDSDEDAILDNCDNCPNDYNPAQEDENSNGVGDVCDGCCLLRGDVNHDGTIGISDLTYFVDFLFGGGPIAPCPEEGDINNDGIHGISDLTFLVDYLFGGGPVPASCD